MSIASAILAHPENLAQFRTRTEPEARYALGLAEVALGNETAAGATWKQAVDALPDDHVDPLTLPLVAALADFERAHGGRDAAVALLKGYIDRSTRELSATHYGVGLLHLVLAEAVADDRAAALVQLDAADAAFAELPDSHPWRLRVAALRRTHG
jgi:hypothetical protein